MGNSILKQPDGKYAVFSSIVDAFIIIDATPEEIIEDYIEDYRKEVTKSIHEKVERMNKEFSEEFLRFEWEKMVTIHNKNSDPKERLYSNREILNKKLMGKGGK